MDVVLTSFRRSEHYFVVLCSIRNSTGWTSFCRSSTACGVVQCSTE